MKKRFILMLAMMMMFSVIIPATANAVKITGMTVKTGESAVAVYDWMAEQMMTRYGIEVEMIGFAEYDQIKLSFEGGEIPTMAYVDDLWQMALQKHGYFIDLTDYVKEYKWIERSVPGAVEFNNLRTPGKYFSVPYLMAPIVVYYNMDIYNELGLKVPETYEELVSNMQACKDAGYVPMEANGLSMYNTLWTMYCMMYTKVGMADINKFYYLQETTETFKEGLKFAAQEMLNWKEKGYLRDEMMGVDESVIIPMFGMGQTAMIVTGDWDLASIEETGLNLGVFNFPTTNPANPLYIVNAVDGAWAITSSATAEEVDAALKYIDLCFEQATLEKWVESGFTPSVLWDTSAIEMSELKRQMMDSVEKAGIGFYLDNAAPGFLDVMIKELQMLFNKEIDIDQYVSEVLAQYDELKATQLASQGN